MNKKELRKIFNEKRNQFSHVQKEKLDDLILIQFQRLHLPDYSFLLSFWPMDGRNEINTHPLTDFLMFQNPGLQLAYPVTDFSTHEMKAVAVNDDTKFKENKYAILEPLSGDIINPGEIDVILMPLLAFDKQGHRVGYGKGFYDRYLSKCRDTVIKIGLSYFDPVEEIKDVSGHDIKMDYCVTPNEIFEFNVF